MKIILKIILALLAAAVTATSLAQEKVVPDNEIQIKELISQLKSDNCDVQETATQKLISLGKPTVIFAVPYSGHEWVGFGALLKQDLGAKAECMLTSDYGQLGVAIRPFRAIHHLREAKILNVTTRSIADYAAKMKDKFGTQIKKITLEDVLDAYKAVDDSKARAEAKRWTEQAEQVVEPSADDIFNAWNRLVHGRPPVRSASLEFLGNLLDKDHRSHVLPLFEASTWEEVRKLGRSLFDIPEATVEATVLRLVNGPDSWLCACTVTLVGELGLSEARAAVQGVVHHPNAVVRQAAASTLKRLDL